MTPDRMARIHAAAMSSRPWSSAEFVSILTPESAFAVTSNQGFAIGRAISDEAELLTIAVHPDAQRSGVGRGLLADFEAEAARRGAATAHLEVAEDNAPARALYDRAGWQMTGRRPDYYARDSNIRVAALILSKALKPEIHISR